MGLRPETWARYHASLSMWERYGTRTQALWLEGALLSRSALPPSRFLKFPFLPSGLLRGPSQKRKTASIVPLTGDLPGFLGGPAGPQGGGGPVQKAAPVGMRGKWVPVVPALPSLPPAEGSRLPERPVPWSVPGKEMEERNGQLQRVC